jgi:hypothetical protein
MMMAAVAVLLVKLFVLFYCIFSGTPQTKPTSAKR